MPTPTSYTVPAGAIDRNATDVPWLVWEQKWGTGPLGEGVELSYSFSASASRFVANYGEGDINEPSGLRLLSAHEKSAIEMGIAEWSLVADVTFVFTEETNSNVGDIRFGKTDFSPGTTAHAYLPENISEAGDVWFKSSTWTDALTPGTFDYYVILHEIGHALGLEHTFTEPLVAPAQYDNHLYSVMAYKQVAQSQPNGAFGSFYPTTPMFYDILAMQSLYGANLTANAGDTTYVYTEGVRYFETIFDTGGNDTIRYDGAQGVSISLAIGAFSSLSATIFFDVGSSRETVCIGPSTLIENAIGGEGADHIIGNIVNNVLEGRGGADTLDGGLGADTMRGGAGNDTYFVDALGDETEEGVDAGADTVVAARSWAVASNIERVLLDGTGDFNAAGNGLANVLRGNGGDNWLNGSFGKDTLTGGKGRDSFIFNRTLGPNNIDTITDYDVPRDVIRIDNAVFAGIGPAGALAADLFNTGAAASEANDRIIYDPATGKLYFDIDGAGGAAQVHFATLTGAPTGMSAAEFIVI